MLDDVPDDENRSPVILRFGETTFHNPWSAVGLNWFCDALRTTTKVDGWDPDPVAGWMPGSAGSMYLRPELEPGVRYFLSVRQSNNGMLYGGAGWWSAAIEVKDARRLLGFGHGDVVPASLVIALQEACWLHAVDAGYFSTSDSFADANVTRVDSTMDLTTGDLDVSAFLLAVSQLHDNARLIRGRGANETLYLPRSKSVTTVLYDKRRQMATFGVDIPPTLRVEVRSKGPHLRPRVKGVHAVTDEAIASLAAEQIHFLGLNLDMSCRVLLVVRAREHGLSDRELVGLHGFLTLGRDGVTMSAPTRRKYRNMAARLGVLGLMDAGSESAYRIDWDAGELTVVDVPEDCYTP